MLREVTAKLPASGLSKSRKNLGGQSAIRSECNANYAMRSSFIRLHSAVPRRWTSKQELPTMEVEEEKEKFLLEIRAQELAAQAEKEKVQEESASALVFPLRIMYSSCFP